MLQKYTVRYKPKIDVSGNWKFYYQHREENPEQLQPAEENFSTEMPVPGYWDDNWHRLKYESFWSKAEFSPYRVCSLPIGQNPPNGSLPHLEGLCWYRRSVSASLVPESENLMAWLHLGAVRLEAWVWVNGNLAGQHDDYTTPVFIPLHPYMKSDEDNTITIAVNNKIDWGFSDGGSFGCDLRGWKGRGGGIRPPAEIIFADGAAVSDLFFHIDEEMKALNCEITCESIHSGPIELDWNISDPENGEVIYKNTISCLPGRNNWSIPAQDFQLWDDENPKMYQADALIKVDGRSSQSIRQRFGLRRMSTEGCGLRLNKRPVYLRGGTEHAYFPETCLPPFSKEYYLKRIRRLKEIGFNWLRFHTYTPPEEYLEAADELGMLMQVEMPRGYGISTRWEDVEDNEESRTKRKRGLEVWDRVVSRCRRHPSVVLYCGGNEEWLTSVKIDELSEHAEVVHRRAPGTLYSPQEAISGVMHHNYGPESKKNERMDKIAHELVMDPFPHHKRFLERLWEFSDVLEPGTFMQLHYSTLNADPEEIDRRLSVLNRPLLAHEVGIISGYLDLSLAPRYSGTLIGTQLFDAARDHLREKGLVHRAAVYARNGAAHQRMLRKHNLENTRLCAALSGYDYIGPIDQHWHRHGYDGGILNEFYEIKPGESKNEILRYNGPNVILCNHKNKRVFKHGEEVSLPFLLSHYTGGTFRHAKLKWILTDEKETILDDGELKIENKKPGSLHTLGTISFQCPQAGPPKKLTLYVQLEGGPCFIENAWDFWSFQETNKPDNADIVTEITKKDMDEIRKGRRVLLLGPGGLPTRKISFQSAFPGRPQGNVATVIEEHACWGGFPRGEWCEWQFYSMISEGASVVFDDLKSPFHPILEMVSSYKEIHPQSCLFEYRIGSGSILVCTLNINKDDIAASFLLQELDRYIQSDSFSPEHYMDEHDIDILCGVRKVITGPDVTDTDMGFDPLDV